MKLGVIVYSNDSETIWNAFRLGNFAQAMGDQAKVSDIYAVATLKELYGIAQESDKIVSF